MARLAFAEKPASSTRPEHDQDRLHDRLHDIEQEVDELLEPWDRAGKRTTLRPLHVLGAGFTVGFAAERASDVNKLVKLLTELLRMIQRMA